MDFKDEKYKNIVKLFDGIQFGRLKWNQHRVNEIQQTLLKSRISKFVVNDTYQYEKRMASITWHPSVPNMVAAATKHGSINVLQGHSDDSNGPMVFTEKFKTKGSGGGGSILSMKFDKYKKECLYIGGMEGTVARLNMEFAKQPLIYYDKKSYTTWFTALDVSPERKLLAAGDTHGQLYLFSLDKPNDKIFYQSMKIHKTKILHCEFHPRDPNLIVTSGLDKKVKLWDLRNFDSDTLIPLETLEHNKGCNVARFSPDLGNHLLTNDQDDEVRVYDGPLWDDPLIIEHHHRQFQHMTPIKASWHPLLTSTIIIGLYPPGRDNKIPRPLQFINSENGELMCELNTPENGIMSLNEFSPTGEILATSSGGRFMLWQALSGDNLDSTQLPSKKNTRRVGKRLPDAMVNILRGATMAARRTRSSEDDDDEEENLRIKKKLKINVKTRTESKGRKSGKGKKSSGDDEDDTDDEDENLRIKKKLKKSQVKTRSTESKGKNKKGDKGKGKGKK